MINPIPAKVWGSLDYYPFGMEMVGRAYNPALYRFGFNGKEDDNEVEGTADIVDFGARIYNSKLGRWFSTDPLQKKYTDLSPYHFSADNPILYIDVKGEAVIKGHEFYQTLYYKAYLQLSKLSATFEKELNGLYAHDRRKDIWLESKRIPKGENAETNYQDENYKSLDHYDGDYPKSFKNVEIRFSNEKDAYNLFDAAVTLIHEFYHVKIADLKIDLNGYGKNGPEGDERQHEYMAKNLRGDMAKMLKEMATGMGIKGLTDEHYDALTWAGLFQTKAFGDLTKEQQEQILKSTGEAMKIINSQLSKNNVNKSKGNVAAKKGN